MPAALFPEFSTEWAGREGERYETLVRLSDGCTEFFHTGRLCRRGRGTYLFDRLAPASGGTPGEPEPRSLILTHSSPAGSLTDQAAQFLKEKVEEASEGQLQIQIYPEDSLGNLDDGRWYFENGAVDMRIGAGPQRCLLHRHLAPHSHRLHSR